ncbi:MAG: peroxiredoxin family protein [Pirellulaceae bacterium]|nr:peroxiredoxin family protein [Pirellulaceae bacterium]
MRKIFAQVGVITLIILVGGQLIDGGALHGEHRGDWNGQSIESGNNQDDNQQSKSQQGSYQQGGLLQLDTFPKVGDTAKDFTLKSTDDKEVTFSSLTKGGNVALVVLRGYPGYHCSICTRQFQQFLNEAENLKKAGIHKVVYIYPGDKKDLKEMAGEKLGKETLPASHQLLLDGDYHFTNLYNLRWDKEFETAYPATFVVNKENKVTFANVSKGHGGRVSPTTLIQAITEKK